MRTMTRRLVLNRETVRSLQDSELRGIVGGGNGWNEAIPVDARAPSIAHPCATSSCGDAGQNAAGPSLATDVG